MPHKSRRHGAAPSRKQSSAPMAPIDGVDVASESAPAGEIELKPDGEQREHMIAEAAYYRALNRGFDGRDPNEDWYAAEREIDGRLSTVH